MTSDGAIRIALDLVHMPSQVRFARSAPLPADVELLLRIVAGDGDAEAAAAAVFDRPRSVIRQAATFFIEQNLLFSEADCYRVLGGSANSASTELRRNMALLLRWLHPDIDREGERAVMARRVAIAWDTLKSAERRASYDRSLKLAAQVARRNRPASASADKPATRRKVPLRAPSRQRALDRIRLWLLAWLSVGNKRRRPST